MVATPTQLTAAQKQAQLKAFFESTPPLGRLLSTQRSWIAGRTGGTPGNSHSTDLMIIKDEGVFIYKPDQVREKIVEIEGEDDYEKILRFHEKNTTRILDHRPDFDYGTRIPGCPNA